MKTVLNEVYGAIRRRRGRFSPLTAAAVAIAALFSIPVLWVAASLFGGLSPLWAHLVDTVLADYVANTAALVLIVGVGVVAIGASTAWLTTMHRFPGRRVFEWALVLPLAVPAYVIAYAYTEALAFSGPVQTGLRAAFDLGPREYWFPQIYSVEGAGAMLTLVLYPYVYLLARAAFITQSAAALDVARSLGCGPWETFYRVALPLARPAIAGGAILALMETLADFGTVSYFGVPTFTTGIYRTWFSMGDQAAAAQLSAALLGFVVLLVLLERLNRGGQRYHETGSGRRGRVTALSGWSAAGACLVCVTPIALGFVVPAVILLDLAVDAPPTAYGARYLGFAWNSVQLAGATAAAAVVLATLVAYAVRLSPSIVTRSARTVASMGYAVPGSVIAIGIFAPFAAFENAVDGVLRATLGVSFGLLLTGSVVALVLAYLVRFLAVAIQTIEAGLSRIRPSIDDAARTLGRSPGRALMSVHAPMLWSSLLTAGMIVFVDVMKELPATLLIRPFNFDTLAVIAYNYAADERLAEAAWPSLTIVLVGLGPVILLTRQIRGDKT